MSESTHSKEKSTVSKKGLPPLPFDLSNLMSLQFDNLKAAIEYLAHQQGEQQLLIEEIITSTPGATVTDHGKKITVDDTSKVINDIDPSQFDEAIVHGIDIVTLKKFVDSLLVKDQKHDIRFEELEDRT